MSEHFNFGQPADMEHMKQEIADRAYSIKIKGMLITAAFGAVALGALVLFPGALGAATPLIGMVGLAGSAVAGLVTFKETKKLQIDEEFLQSRMQGKNYWGGYREEVGHYHQPSISPYMGGPAPSQHHER